MLLVTLPMWCWLRGSVAGRSSAKKTRVTCFICPLLMSSPATPLLSLASGYGHFAVPAVALAAATEALAAAGQQHEPWAVGPAARQ